MLMLRFSHIQTKWSSFKRAPFFVNAPIQSGVLLRAGMVCLWAVVSLLFLPVLSQAANDNSSYVTPFPAGGTYKVLVLGDGYADGAWLGLSRVLKTNKKIELFKEVGYSFGLMSKGRKDWVKKLDGILAKRAYDIAVVMIGINDRQALKIGKKRYYMDSEEWRSRYRQRILQVLRKLASKKISVYWVGMPIVRQSKVRSELETINDMVKLQAASAQVRYIDNWLHFANDDGQYSAYGPDVNGKIRLLRSKDGFYFTRAGYEKLGYFIDNFIQRDLRSARAERDVPLLGSKSDQNYLLTRHNLDNPRNRRLSKKNSDKTGGAGQLSRLLPKRSKYETVQHSSVTLAADKSQTGKEVVFKIIRPAIPAAAFTISKRVSAFSGQDDTQADAVLMKEVYDNQIGFSISSSIGQVSSNNGNRRVPLTQTPYYKLVVRGDALTPKAGRADQFLFKNNQ